MLHAVAEGGIATRDTATALGQFLDVPVQSIPDDHAQAHFGGLGTFFGVDARPPAYARVRCWAGSRPHDTLLEDIAAGHHPGN